jgi:uncharacterized membrane protein
MQSERDLIPTPPAGLIFPTTRTEFVNLIAHYYRGEMGRMTSWRDRVDRTSNWAITVKAADCAPWCALVCCGPRLATLGHRVSPLSLL